MIPTVTTRLLAIAAVTAAFLLPPGAQAATITFTTPFQADVPACNGDTIHLTGQLLITFSVTSNSASGIMVASHMQPQGIAGTDLTTGSKYLGTGLTRDLATIAPTGTNTFSLINRFHIQATAGADSFDVSETLHVTQFADGSVAAFVDNFSPACS